MTDVAQPCKDSPDGQHHFDCVWRKCAYCFKRQDDLINVEDFWRDIGRPGTEGVPVDAPDES